ncbi:hypothetical protein J6590_096364 [Homalodisca vitripennis]|nr:hypothetical protein J6590_096364 [Homalodisca vitripennis]
MSIIYADDTTLCISGKSKSLMEERTFVEINNNCVQHFNSLNLKTNTSKTNVINFALRPVDSECGPAVLTADSILVYNSKFLGIHLNRGLTWNDHIDHPNIAYLGSDDGLLRLDLPPPLLRIGIVGCLCKQPVDESVQIEKNKRFD